MNKYKFYTTDLSWLAFVEWTVWAYDAEYAQEHMQKLANSLGLNLTERTEQDFI